MSSIVGLCGSYEESHPAAADENLCGGGVGIVTAGSDTAKEFQNLFQDILGGETKFLVKHLVWG